MKIVEMIVSPGKLHVKFASWAVAVGLLFLYLPVTAQHHAFATKYMVVSVNKSGYIISIRDRATKKEYCPAGDSSALLSLYKNKEYILPVGASFARGRVSLRYPNGSVATVKIEQKAGYLRFQLLSLSPRNEVDNIVWGPYKTSISQTIGEIISVVRNDEFAIGIQALDMVTTSGPPSEGDLPQSYYIVHAPPGVALPAGLHEGQTFNVGGDSLGTSDIAFNSRPEEYFRYMTGDAAMLRPYGSDIVLHARDRKIPQVINFKPRLNSPDRHQYIAPIDADFIGSAIAFFGCPATSALDIIEKIELAEGLPHPMLDGKWVKDPRAAKPFLAWYGVHDSLVSYAQQLGFEAVQDESLGEYYYNPADIWDHKKVNFSHGSMSIREYTAITNKAGIAYGLHTLCEFIQPNSSDVTPVPNDSLCKVGSTVITRDISDDDTVITIADPTFFRESGGWENIHRNVVKTGRELISYEGVSTTAPYTLLHPGRGWDHTEKSAHRANDIISKLMPNAYAGFAPDIYLQDQYAKDYARLLNEGGMDYIDFDGLESCWYQGQGQYSIKRFYDTLFTYLHHYIRNTGSGIFEGNWHYMSSLDVGGNLFNPATNAFSIEGKDMREVYVSNLLHVSFGLVNFSSRWNAAITENLEAKAIGWNGQYMLGLSEREVERCGEKQEIFDAVRTWERARDARAFSAKQLAALRVLENRFHLQQTGLEEWNLYPVKELYAAVTPEGSTGASRFTIRNPFLSQPLRFTMQVAGEKGSSFTDITLQLNGKTMQLKTALKARQYVVCRNNRVFITDENWNKLSAIDVKDIPLLGAGDNDMEVSGRFSGSSSPALHFTFSVMGSPEKLKGTR